MKAILQRVFFRSDPMRGALFALSLLLPVTLICISFLIPAFQFLFSFTICIGTPKTVILFWFYMAVELLAVLYYLILVCRLYRLYIPRFLFAGSCLAAAVSAGAVWYCGGFSIPATLIPTYIRRDLWLQGDLLFAIPLFLNLAAGLFLPLATVRKRRGAFWAILAFACFSGAACCTIFGTGMISNRFKYFSLGAISDLSSPEWEHPHAIALSFAAALLLLFAATLCRLKFWSELTK